MVEFGNYLFFVPGGQDGVDPALASHSIIVNHLIYIFDISGISRIFSTPIYLYCFSFENRFQRY